MMSAEKPEILIGYTIMNDKISARIDEVKYGIEEEGCLYRLYSMKNNEDVQFTMTNVTVCLEASKGLIYCNDIPAGKALLTLNSDDLYRYRQLGTNAARYLKNLSLRMENERL